VQTVSRGRGGRDKHRIVGVGIGRGRGGWDLLHFLPFCNSHTGAHFSGILQSLQKGIC